MLLLLSSHIFAQQFNWAKCFNGNYVYANGIAKDNLGNNFVVGNFSDYLNVDGHTLTAFGSSDIFIAKLDNAGNVIWLKKAGEIGIFACTLGNKKIVLGLAGSYIEKNPKLYYFFELEIGESGRGLAWYDYVIGGTLAGGTAAALILTSESKTETAPVTIGAPPVRPKGILE